MTLHFCLAFHHFLAESCLQCIYNWDLIMGKTFVLEVEHCLAWLLLWLGEYSARMWGWLWGCRTVNTKHHYTCSRDGGRQSGRAQAKLPLIVTLREVWGLMPGISTTCPYSSATGRNSSGWVEESHFQTLLHYCSEIFETGSSSSLKFFPIWKSDFCPNSINHRCSRNSAMFVL